MPADSDEPRTTGERQVHTALLIELRPQSIEYRRYLQPIMERTFLETCLDSICESLQSARFTVVAFDEQEGECLQKLLDRFPCELFISRSATDLGAICALAEHTAASDVAAVSLECLLAPSDLLPRVIRHHLDCNNDFTAPQGLPGRVGPIIFKSSFAEQLNQLELPGASDCSSCIALLTQLESTGAAPDFPFRSAPFKAAQAYGLEDVVLPYSMSLEYPNEIRIADKALRSASRVPASEYHPMEKLLSFHKEAVSNQRTRALESAARVSVVHDWNRNQIPRVLYVSNGAGFSGAEESLCQLLRQLSPARFERFALVSLEGSFTRRLRKAGVTVICPNNDFAELSLDNVHFLLSVCREIRPDIIHLNGLDGFPILAASSLLEIPLIMHVRNGVTEPYREYVHQAAKVITVSNFLKQKMLTLGVPHENVQVVYDEIDVSSAVRLPPRNQSRRLFGLAENAAVVAMVARFVPYKRHDLMIQAAAFLRERIPNLHLLFVGEASEKSAYVQSVLALITRLRLEDAVTWVPFTEDIRQVYAAADVLTLCSDGEGLGRCVVEAMLMGVPVVVTDSGGSKEVISHGRTGLVVGSNDHIGLAEAVAQLLADDFLRRKCAAEASDFVRRHLSSQASARAIEQMYEKILSARDAP